MTDVTSFLTEGSQIPSGSALKATQTTQTMPSYMTDYAQNILSMQQNVSNRPYTAPPMPAVAGQTADQTAAQDITRGSVGTYGANMNNAMGALANTAGLSTLGVAQPSYDAATALTLAGTQNMGTSAATPMYNAALSRDPASVAQPYMGGALNYFNQGAQSITGSGEPYFSTAAGMNPLGEATGYYDAATGQYNASTGNSGLSVAQPYLDAASRTSPDVISKYMNPYQDAVVNRLGELAARQLREKLLPQIEGRYIAAGQLGLGGPSSGQMIDMTRALRDVQADVLAQQAATMAQGYSQAQDAANTDLGRQATLAGTAGGLGVSQQQVLANAAKGLSDIGTSRGNLSLGAQGNLTNIGTAQGNLAAANQRNLIDAGTGLSSIGQYFGNLEQGRQNLETQIGTQLGQFGNAQQQALLAASDNLTGIGSAAAADYGRDIAGQRDVASNLAALADRYQTGTLNTAAALNQQGEAQRQLDQANLDAQRAEFLRQQGYPQTQIDAMLNALRGTAAVAPTSTSEVGIVPTGEYGASTASQIAGGLSGLAAIAQLAGII